MKGPCLNCTKRTIQPNCHSTCEAYLNYRKQLNEINEKRQSRVDLESEFYAIRKSKFKRLKK